jgi:hypothetical protein
MTTKSKPIRIIYTILADDKPVVALEATGTEARELLRERWFIGELAALKVNGEPLYKSGTRLRARPATEKEWSVYDLETSAIEGPEEVQFVYLAPLDSY